MNTSLSGQRVFTCAHSFHHFVPPLLAEIAASAGIKGHESVGLSMIGGSRVAQHWQVPDAENKAKDHLANGAVDILTLSPIYLPDEGIENFARLAFSRNPRAQVTVQEFWLPNDRWDPTYPLNTKLVVDHDACSIDELRAAHVPYFSGMETEIRRINTLLGHTVVLGVPVAQAVLSLRELVIAGKAAPLSRQSELFTDSWGHPAIPLQVMNAYCHFAVIYRRSPEGLQAPSLFSGVPALQDPPGLNALLQRLAWEAVVAHPLSGLDQNSLPA